MALAGRSLALPDFSELGGEGVMVCFAEKGLCEDALTDRGWLLLEKTNQDFSHAMNVVLAFEQYFHVVRFLFN